jgi:hypothetical protein
MASLNGPVASQLQVQLYNLTFRDNDGEAGAALRVGQSVCMALDGCVFENNTASDSIVQADKKSVLWVYNCNFTSNEGTALVFQGNGLGLRYSHFVKNSANSSALQQRFLDPQSVTQSTLAETDSTSQLDDMDAMDTVETDLGLAADAGAVRIPSSRRSRYKLQLERTPVLFVEDTTFIDNSGGAGGAVFLGSLATAFFLRSTFKTNAAYWRGGGAIFAARDSCLYVETTVFIRNTAKPSPW